MTFVAKPKQEDQFHSTKYITRYFSFPIWAIHRRADGGKPVYDASWLARRFVRSHVNHFTVKMECRLSGGLGAL